MFVRMLQIKGFDGVGASHYSFVTIWTLSVCAVVLWCVKDFVAAAAFAVLPRTLLIETQSARETYKVEVSRLIGLRNLHGVRV